MRPWAKILLFVTFLTVSVMVSSSASARSAGLCLECHSLRYLQSVNRSAPAWDRSVYLNRLDPCPGIRSLSEEIFFTESRIVKINEILKGVEKEGWATDALKRKTSQTAESFSRMKEREIPSIRQFVREASGLRSGLQKVYDQAFQERAESSHRLLIGVGVLLFFGVMVLLGIGFKKLERMGKTLLLFLLVGGCFSSGACSSSPVETARKSPAQEELEQSLSVAAQASQEVEEVYDRSILLAQIAGDWSRIDPVGSDRAFQLAWKMALKNQEEAGRLLSLQGVLSQWIDPREAGRKKVNYDTVLDLRDELRSTEGRAWALRAIAEEWVRAQQKNGRSALEAASQKAQEIQDPEIRDRDLKSIAIAWAGVDENRAREISRSITDPFLKSLSLVNLALTTPDQDRAGNLIREAWKAAQSIASPFPQSKALARISAAGAKIFPREKEFWADSIMGQNHKMKNPVLQDVALQEAIFEWALVDIEQAERWADAISPEFSEGRAYSFWLMAQKPGIPPAQARTLFRRALTESGGVTDPFQSQKIKSLVGKGLAKIDPQEAAGILPQIPDPFFRSELLEQIAGSIAQKDRGKALKLAERIPLEPLRTKAVVRIIAQGIEPERERISSLYGGALQAASSILDPYARALTLIDLGKDWGGLEKGGEAVPFEAALKIADQISSPSFKAEILETLSAAWKGFDPVRSQALLGKIDPSVISARKSLAEIRLWAKTGPGKVRGWIDALPPGFSYEKALALKEVAVNLKKSQSPIRLEVLGAALQQALTLPEGPKQGKLLSELISEAALQDKEWTMGRISQLQNRRMRDTLFKEAGTIWAKEDPLWALKATREISEGSLRMPLYQKIAEGAAKRQSRARTEETQSSLLSALISWGQGREKAKREELEAVPFFEKALQEVEKVADPVEKSYLVGALAAEWAPLDEQRALKVAEKNSSKEFYEPFSWALLQVGIQYGKWNRKEAESVFEKTLSAAGRMEDSSHRAERLIQLARQWGVIDREKGKRILLKAEKEIQSMTSGDSLLAQILEIQVNWEPENCLVIVQNTGSPALRAKVLLEGARVLRGRSLEESVKALERARQSAQKEKNFRLMGDVAVAWYSLAPQKGLEILGQVETKEIRVNALLQMARANGSKRREEAKSLLDVATDETMTVERLTQKAQFLKEIGHEWAGIDKERAEATYLKAFQILEREYLTSSHF